MRSGFENAFGRGRDCEQGGAPPTNAGRGSGDDGGGRSHLEPGVTVAELVELREEVDQAQTNLSADQALNAMAASQKMKSPKPLATAAARGGDGRGGTTGQSVVGRGLGSDVVEDARAAAAEWRVAEGDPQRSVWSMLLARVSRKLGALSPAERSMLRAAWDHASTMAAQFAATNQLTSRRADRADAWMMVEHEYDQLLDRLDDWVELSNEDLLLEHVGSVNAAPFCAQLTHLFNEHDRASISALKARLEEEAARLQASQEAFEDFGPRLDELDVQLQRHFELICTATRELQLLNWAALSAARTGAPPASTDMELSDAMVAPILLDIARLVLQVILALMLAIWATHALFDCTLWLVDRFVFDAMASSTFGRLLGAVRNCRRL